MSTEQLEKFVTENYKTDENGMHREKKRAAVYVRYSSENQRDGYSVEYQLDECKKYMAENDMLFVNSYIDEATTGKNTANRTAFFEMLADVKRGLYDCVVVYKYSRFARNLVEATLYRQQIEKAGAKLISAMERIDDSTPEGKMMRNIIMVMDEYYSDNLSVFVQSSMYTAAKDGKVMGGSAPLGYRINEEKRYEIYEHEAKIVRSIFELYAGGFSLADVIRWANDHGYRTRRGNHFSESGIYAILRNEKYIGRFVYEVTGYDAIIIDHALPRIIDDETWHRVQERIARNVENKHQPRPRLKERVYPLTGKITCACCGNAFFGQSKFNSKQKDKEYNYYTCRGKKRLKICENKDVRKEQLEDYVFSEIKKHMLNPDVIDKISRETYELVSGGVGDIHAEISAIKAQRAKIERRMEKLLDAMLDGDIPKSVMNRKSAQLNTELADLQAQLDKKQIAAVTAVTYDMVHGYLTQLMNDLEHGDEDMKKAVASQMVRKITIGKDDIDVEIGVNFNYFFRDNLENGSPNLRLSQKRENLRREFRDEWKRKRHLLSSLKDKLLNMEADECEIYAGHIRQIIEYAEKAGS